MSGISSFSYCETTLYPYLACSHSLDSLVGSSFFKNETENLNIVRCASDTGPIPTHVVHDLYSNCISVILILNLVAFLTDVGGIMVTMVTIIHLLIIHKIIIQSLSDSLILGTH